MGVIGREYRELPDDHPDMAAAQKLGGWATRARRRVGATHRPFGVKLSDERAQRMRQLRKVALERAGVLSRGSNPFGGSSIDLTRLDVANTDSLQERLKLAAVTKREAAAQSRARGEVAFQAVQQYRDGPGKETVKQFEVSLPATDRQVDIVPQPQLHGACFEMQLRTTDMAAAMAGWCSNNARHSNLGVALEKWWSENHQEIRGNDADGAAAPPPTQCAIWGKCKCKGSPDLPFWGIRNSLFKNMKKAFPAKDADAKTLLRNGFIVCTLRGRRVGEVVGAEHDDLAPAVEVPMPTLNFHFGLHYFSPIQAYSSSCHRGLRTCRGASAI